MLTRGIDPVFAQKGILFFIPPQAAGLSNGVKVDIIYIDRYKGMVGIIYLDKRDINLEMVRGGWAWAYREYLDRPYASAYLNAEKEARGKRSGLWIQANPQPPWEFRKLMRIR